MEWSNMCTSIYFQVTRAIFECLKILRILFTEENCYTQYNGWIFKDSCLQNRLLPVGNKK